MYSLPFTGGYSQHTVQFFPSQPDALKSLPVVVYVGEETHPQYAGPAKIEDMAHTICYSVGPSGTFTNVKLKQVNFCSSF